MRRRPGDLAPLLAQADCRSPWPVSEGRKGPAPVAGRAVIHRNALDREAEVRNLRRVREGREQEVSAAIDRFIESGGAIEVFSVEGVSRRLG